MYEQGRQREEKKDIMIEELKGIIDSLKVEIRHLKAFKGSREGSQQSRVVPQNFNGQSKLGERSSEKRRKAANNKENSQDHSLGNRGKNLEMEFAKDPLISPKPFIMSESVIGNPLFFHSRQYHGNFMSPGFQNLLDS